jgi:hypothetical protein
LEIMTNRLLPTLEPVSRRTYPRIVLPNKVGNARIFVL